MRDKLCGIRLASVELGQRGSVPIAYVSLAVICIENIHAAYEGTGSSIRDSFRGQGARTLVLNDEAHHLFNQAAKKSEWLKFLLNPEFSFRHVVNLTCTPYVDDA